MWKLLEPRSTAASTSGTDFGARRATSGALASGGEGRAATAGGLGVRIANDELGAVEPLAVVDFRASEVLHAHGVDEQLHAEVLHAGIAILLLLIEFEAVLHARAPTPLHEHAQLQVRIALATDEIANLAGSCVGELEGFGLDFAHGLH